MTQIDELRRWRNESISSHLYSTAELVSTKILAMSGHPEDAYWLAQTYYGMGEYIRGAEIILKNHYEQVSMKCRYISVLCLIRAEELDNALEIVEAGINESVSTYSTNLGSIHSPVTPLAGSNLRNQHSPFSHQPHISTQQPPARPTNQRVRVVSTSSLRAPGASGARTISGSSRISMILPDDDSDNHGGIGHGGAGVFGSADNTATGTAGLGERDEEAVEELNNVFVHSLLHYLLGRIHTAQSRFVQAKAAYIAALRTDARCFEAYAQLIRYHTMTPLEEWQLLDSLDFTLIGSDFGRSIYALRLSTTLRDVGLKNAIENLLCVYQIPDTDSDILLAQAEIFYERGAYSHARVIFEKVRQLDPRNLRIYMTYADCLLELKDINALYKTSHELAMFAQEAPETWYVIGVYYLSRGHAAEARQYFSKASIIDPGCSNAWVAFAQTFAEEAEHEQAITAFSTAVRLFPGYSIPYIYIGIQYLQLLNLPLARKYLDGAVSRFGDDPLVLNELGLVHYLMDEVPLAISTLGIALKLAESNNCDQSLLSAIKANKAFALRKQGHVREALDTFTEIAHYTRLDVNVLTTTALCYMQLEQYHDATTKLAQALALDGNYPVANELMRRAMQATAGEFDIPSFVRSNAHLISNKRRLIKFD